MDEVITTVLEAAALVGLSVGVFFAVERWMDGAAMIPASVVLGAGSAFLAWWKSRGGVV